MDLQELYKVDSRKRLNVEAEKLREKVSHETAKIIKLKVAQDTAYWDLKEKLQQVEGNHEKLQQNMVEVQMQHEAISGQYQEELRLRPETLNKVSSTREICDVLEQYSERLKGALARCRADQAALAAAYERSGGMLQELHDSRRADAEKNRAQVAALQEKVCLLSSQQSQLLQLLSGAQKQARAERGELRAHAAAADTRADALLAARHQLERDLAQCSRELEEKNQMNSKLEADIRNIMQEFKKQATEAAAVFSNQNKQIKELKAENIQLKEAVHNQEQFTKSINDQNNILQESIATLEDERVSLIKTREELLAKNEEATSLIQGLQKNVSSLYDEKLILFKNVQETQQVITDLEEDIKNLKVKHTTLESEKSDVVIRLNTVTDECNKKEVEVGTLTGITEELAAKVTGLEAALEAHRIETEKNHKELNDSIVAKNTELDSKATTINKLMSEVKKLEDMLQRIKKEMDIERDGVKEKETKMNNKIGHLETTVADKEDQLSKQMTIIQEMRNDKERLVSKVQSMQSAMDNIQRQLSQPRTPPHFDDNARFPSLSNERAQTQLAAPRAPEHDELMFNLFSDTSVDDDAAHMAEVNRRFNALARGERLSPVPAALRRRGGALRQRHGGPSNSRSNDGQVSLSQLRNEMKNKNHKFFKNKTRQ